MACHTPENRSIVACNRNFLMNTVEEHPVVISTNRTTRSNSIIIYKEDSFIISSQSVSGVFVSVY